MNLSPEALALSRKPDGVMTIAITARDQWLKLREADVTASIAAILLGADHYQTYWGLWMQKAGRLAPEPVASDPEISADGDEITMPPAGRGHAREAETVSMLQLLRPDWRVSYPLSAYWRNAGRHIGATPDCLVVRPDRQGFGVVQCKTVDPIKYREQWIDPDTQEVVPPVWIAVQAIVEAKLTGASWATVAVHRENWGSRPSVRIIDVLLHEGVWTGLVSEVETFWNSIEAGAPPHPDFRRDASGIMRLYADAEDRILTLDGDKASRALEIVAAREALKAREADGGAAEKERKVLDAELIWIMGNADTARLPDGRMIRAPTSKRINLDAEIIRKEMGADWAAQRSKLSTWRTVAVKAMKEGKAA